MRKPAAKAKPAPKMAPATERVQSRFPAWLVAALLALVTVALYWPAMRCGFINYDDPEFLTANPHVQSGLNWEGVKWAFGSTEQSFYWAPLMWLSHMLAWQLFGLNAWGHHLINVLLHAANTALVFLVFRRITQAPWRSLMLAALFGLHPLRVESVAWITERKDVLSTLFWLLTMWAYARYAEVQSQEPASRIPHSASRITIHVSRYYLLSLSFFALGLMSKAMLVTLPCVLLLLDYWPLRRLQLSTLNSQPSTLQRLVWEKVPFFALAAVGSVMTFVVQKHGGGLAAGEALPLGERSANALVSYCRYLGKLFWPTNLAVFYPHPGHWPLAKVLLAGGLLLGISVLLLVKRRQYPCCLVGWLWYCGTLVPAIGLVQSGSQAMADRFTYVPSLGVLLLVIWGACELTRRWQHHRIVLSVLGSGALILCMALTWQQLGCWKDSEALFRHALQVTENNYIAHNILGTAFALKGRNDEAISQFQEAIRLKPDFLDARNNLGAALDRIGQTDAANRQFEGTLTLNPDYAEVHFALGVALTRKGQTDEAIHQFQEAIRLKPGYAAAHYNLGNALIEKGQIDEAISQLQEAIRLNPSDAATRNNLGNTFGIKGQIDEAIRQFQEAIRLDPDYAEAHYNLGNALGGKGQIDEAINQLQEAIRLKPDNAAAHNNLGTAFAMKGQIDKAISQFQEAARLKPDDAGAHNNLGRAFGIKGHADAAILQFQEALRLKPDYPDASNNLRNASLKKGQPGEAPR